MAEEAIGVSGLAGRYATALFDFAKERAEVDITEKDLIVLGAMLDDNRELKRLIRSPVIGREEQGRAITAVADKMKLGDLTKRFLGLLARNRRLFVLREVVTAFAKLSGVDRGEMMAEVISAETLTESQLSAISGQLRGATGTNVVVKSRVDETLLGGLIIKIGSRMMDSSLRSKLERMKLKMKGVG